MFISFIIHILFTASFTHTVNSIHFFTLKISVTLHREKVTICFG